MLGATRNSEKGDSVANWKPTILRISPIRWFGTFGAIGEWFHNPNRQVLFLEKFEQTKIGDFGALPNIWKSRFTNILSKDLTTELMRNNNHFLDFPQLGLENFQWGLKVCNANYPIREYLEKSRHSFFCFSTTSGRFRKISVRIEYFLCLIKHKGRSKKGQAELVSASEV